MSGIWALKSLPLLHGTPLLLAWRKATNFYFDRLSHGMA